MAFVYRGKVPGSTRAERARNLTSTMRTLQRGGVSSANLKFSRSGDVVVKSKQLTKPIILETPTKIEQGSRQRISLAGVKSDNVRQAIAQRLMDRGQIIVSGALKKSQEKMLRQGAVQADRFKNGVFEITDPSTGIAELRGKEEVQRITAIEDKMENLAFKQKMESERPLTYKAANYVYSGLTGYAEGFKKTFGGGQNVKQILNNVRKGIANEVYPIIRGFGKTLEVVRFSTKEGRIVTQNLYNAAQKIKASQKYLEKGQLPPQSLSIKNELKTISLIAGSPESANILKYRNDPDVRALATYAAAVGVSFVGAPLFGWLSAGGFIRRATGTVLGTVFATSYALQVGHEAREKGLISAATEAILMLGAIHVGASAASYTGLIQKAKKIDLKKARQELKKMSKKKRGVLEKLFRRGEVRLKQIEAKQRKLAKRVHELRIELNSKMHTTTKAKQIRENIIKLTKAYKKLGGEKSLIQSEIVSKKFKLTKTEKQIKKLEYQLKQVLNKLNKEPNSKNKHNLVKKAEKLDRKINNLKNVKYEPSYQKLTKSKIKKELKKINKELEVLYKRYKNTHLLRTTRAKIKQKIIKLEMNKKFLQTVQRTGKSSAKKLRKAQRNEIIRNLNRAEARISKLNAREISLKELAIKRVRAKGKMVKALRKEPISSGKHKGFYELKTDKGSSYFRSYRQWKKAVIRQEKQFLKKVNSIENTIKYWKTQVNKSKGIEEVASTINKVSQARTKEAKQLQKQSKSLIDKVKNMFKGKRSQQKLVEPTQVVKRIRKVKSQIIRLSSKLKVKSYSLTKALLSGSGLLSGAVTLRRDMALLGLMNLALSKIEQILLQRTQIKMLSEEQIQTPTTIVGTSSDSSTKTAQIVMQSLIISTSLLSVLVINSRLFNPLLREKGEGFPFQEPVYSMFGRKPKDYFKYLPDLQSLVFGIKATRNEARNYLRVGRVFTGLEIRKVI